LTVDKKSRIKQKIAGFHSKTSDFGAAAQIRTGDLILTNRLDSISGHARSATGKPPGALYFKDPGGFIMPVRAQKPFDFSLKQLVCWKSCWKNPAGGNPCLCPFLFSCIRQTKHSMNDIRDRDLRTLYIQKVSFQHVS
jgi:hypothetical protein